MVQGTNAPWVCSLGRLFDAVSSILDVCQHSRYEAQAAIELEMAADGADAPDCPFELDRSQRPWQIDVRPTIRRIVEDLQAGVDTARIAAGFHATVAEIAASVCGALASERPTVKNVVLSGGCFQNVRLLRQVRRRLEAVGFVVHTHRRVPPNDGGIALGQAAVANARIHSDVRGRTGETR
jgi:hydrogenase maturation protein HypF